MYHPPPPREPNGCLQTLVITKVILQILFIPMLLILGALFAVFLFIFAFSENPLLGLLVVAGAGFLLYAAVQWERKRIEREMPPED
jgi:hypothetical protein